MKKFFILAVFVVCELCVSAQTKVAYLDLYQRGGGKNLTTTVMYNQNPIEYGSMNLGEALNFLAEKGWIVDQILVGARRVGPFAWFTTRHKFHIILKKEYQQGENPFEGLSVEKNDANVEEQENAPEVVADVINDEDAMMKRALKSLELSIKRKYNELKNNPSIIIDNIDEFNSMVNQYRDNYVQLYGKVPDDVDNLLQNLMDINSKNQRNQSLKKLELSIKRKYNELKNTPSIIADNIDEFNSMVNQYRDNYVQIYGKTPDDADYMVNELTKLSDKYENNRSLKELELSIKRKYEELKKEPSAILDNIEEFDSMVKEYREKYVQVYGVAPYNIDDLSQKLMEISAKKSK